jgi:steroid delta-isomerase-like uncharacterized protein
VSVAENKAVVRRFIEEGINGRNLALFDEVFAPDFVWHGGSLGETRDLETFKAVVGPFVAAFPDLAITIDDFIGEDDRVVGRLTVRATHQGDFFGVPATGAAVEWSGNSTYRLANGKIVEEWYFEDLLGLMKQLGAVPA